MYCSSGLTSFLERVHKEKGEKSAIYISFGPVLLPKNIEMLYGVLRILKELDIPDIMAMSNAASAALPEDLKGNKNTFIRPWLPQQYILAHSVYGCGYELSQVCLGYGLKHCASTWQTPMGTIEDVTSKAKEMFQKAFFNKDERAKIDANIAKMADSLNAAWEEGGEARDNSLKLLKYIESVHSWAWRFQGQYIYTLYYM
ncbi:hypothetical protein BDQ17DRAFT_1505714 [Cyathus striatus]|nr:hypothetical protein BDQ17DRAFT_1505714 [Cyathus striatus]